MLETGVVQGWEIRKNRDGKRDQRVLQVIVTDPDDIRPVEWFGDPGRDFGFYKGMEVLIGKVGSTDVAFAARDIITPSADDGENKLYATDGAESPVKTGKIDVGNEVDIEGEKVSLTGDPVTINGENDNLISFAQLETILTQLVARINEEDIKRILAGGQTAIPIEIDLTQAKTLNIKIGF